MRNDGYPDSVEGRYQIQSVARAATLLDAVGEAGENGLGITEMARALKVAKSTAVALARTLAMYGLLRVGDPGPRYVLGLKLLRLGDIVRQQTSIAGAALPILRDLSSATGMTSRLAVNEGGFPVFLERIDGMGSVRFHAPLGQREEPHATAAGKAILAELGESEVQAVIDHAGMAQHTPKTLRSLVALLSELERVRNDGFAIDDEEEAEGIVCLGAPFFDHKGACTGALSITGLKVDIAALEVHRLGMIVREHANRVTSLFSGTLPRRDQ